MVVNDFPHLLKQERIRRGWTQQRLAEELKTTRISIYRWEQRGIRPDFVFWESLSEFLGVEVGSLFVESPDPHQSQVMVSGSLAKEENASDEKSGEIPSLSEQSQISDVLNSQKPAEPLLDHTYLFPLWEQDLQLELERKRVEIQDKQLEVRQKWLHHTNERITSFLNLLDPQQDQRIREQVTGTILSALEESFEMMHYGNLPLPTFQMVNKVFEAIKQKQQQAQVGQVNTELSVTDIQHCLEHLDDPARLGESKLIHFHPIRIRFEAENMAPRERGLIVRQALYEAWESLHAPGPRTDIGLDWQSYNILYYRYFKYRLRNHQVAARLALSDRSDFRAKHRAIEDLLYALKRIKVDLLQSDSITPDLDVN